MLKKFVTSGAVIAALTMGAVNTAQAQFRSDKAIYFTFSQPVALPSVTLPAGKYLFRLADSLSNRQIVQVFSGDGLKLQAMMMTLPVMRNDTPNDAELRFLETESSAPPAIATYWYPGQKDGWEFIYPRAQARTLAKASKKPVLTTATDANAEEMKTAKLVRVSPTGEEAAYNDSAAKETVTLADRTERGAFAEDTAVSAPAQAQNPRSTAMAQGSQAAPAPAPARVQSQSSLNDRSNDEMRTALPATASAMPTIALVGLLALAGAFWLTRRAHA